MKRYVEIFTNWNGEENKGSVLIEGKELTPEEHSVILKLLEDNKFIITDVKAMTITGYLDLPHEETFNIAKKFIEKGFKWKPEEDNEPKIKGV